MKPTLPDAPPPSQTRLRIDRVCIRFLPQQGLLSVLEVEVPGAFDVLRPIYRSLWTLRAQVVEAEHRTEGGRTVHRLMVVEFDGAPLPPARRLQIQAEIAGMTGDLLGADETRRSRVDRALLG